MASPYPDEMVPVTTTKLEKALKRVSQQASVYETQMKDLDAKLSASLANFRTVDSLLDESVRGVRHTTHLANNAQTNQIPRMHTGLDESLEDLVELKQSLPVIAKHVKAIHDMYDRGRGKANELLFSLKWLNTPLPSRWRTIIVSPSSTPVSTRWKALVQAIFVLCLILCAWLAWIVLLGAYRAWRHKLVWGERLMS